jgi:hypothetical protein
VGAELSWSEWVPLEAAWLNVTVPRQAGVYRIRSDHDVVLDYVGQTGMGTMNLRRRLAMLAGIWGDEMPYRDPHTAGPALWAWRQSGRCAFEVSVVAATSSTPVRKGLECLAISRHRWSQGCSPRWNFGRMPNGYVMSSPNNRRLVDAGRRFRGGLTEVVVASHVPGIAPLAGAGDDPAGPGWGGLDWSSWTPVGAAAAHALGTGLYRFSVEPDSGLIYVGEGNLSARLVSHLSKAARPEHRQAASFSLPDLRCSWVEGTWAKHQRLELENDLIANHVERHGIPPRGQFLG